MKRLLVIGLTLFFSPNILASSVSLNIAPLDEYISVSDINLTQVQAKLQCRFASTKNKNDHVVRERYILTRLDPIDMGRYRVRTGRGQLKAWLPDHKLLGCGYKLITLGEDLEGNALIGDITLLDKSLNKDEASTSLKKRLASLLIGKLGERDQAILGVVIQD